MKVATLSLFITVCLLLCLTVSTRAQVHTDTLSFEESEMLRKQIDRELKRSERKYTYQISPIIYYTPETRWAFGAGAIFQFKFDANDSLLRESKVSPSFVYTVDHQMLAQVSFDLYTNNNWRVFGDVGYFIYPYFFGGVGNDEVFEPLEKYDASYPRLNLNVYRKIMHKSLSIGLRYDYQNSKVNPGTTKLAIGNYPGAYGSVQSSLGVGVMFDTRDYVLAPTKGLFADVSVMVADHWTGSSYKDEFIRLDFRKYVSLSSKKDVLAIQVYSEVHQGEVPFNLMSLLGGPNLMRGYFRGKYRDRQMMVYQIEYRSRLFFKYFGLAAFANVGGIGDDFNEVNANYRYTLGGGVRISPVPDERYFIRIDYGAGQNTQGLYIAIGEAF